MYKKYLFVFLAVLLMLSSCATYELKYSEEDQVRVPLTSEDQIASRFFFIGDAGHVNPEISTPALKALEKLLDSTATKKDYTLFLGNNSYRKGLPSKKSKHRDAAIARLKAQVKVIEDFKGTTFFMPGNRDWYSDGLKGLERQEDFIEDALDNNDAFQPEKGCPIEEIDVSEDIVLFMLDTQWYLANWDNHPTINDKCDIKTRKAFFLEIENELKKNNEKTIIMAMHHPMFTNGSHGGKYGLQQHLFPFDNGLPLPVLGSLAAQVRLQGSVAIQDRYNKRYNELMDRLQTLAIDSQKAIFVSSHDQNLQYIDHNGIKQIVSGSGSRESQVALGNDGLFAYGRQGLAVLEVLKNGASIARYYSAEKGVPKEIYSTVVHPADTLYDTSNLKTRFSPTIKATVYDTSATNKSKRYERFWGQHYRKVYGTELEVPVVTLDTFMGGFSVDRKGGGHQTRSLRLVTKDGRNFALRAVKKSAVQFLQTVVFKDNFVQDEFRETFTEDVILDFYTASHPFASLSVGGLADAVGIYHTNPTLVWMPKHPALGKYNAQYGDELYVIEERPDNGFVDVASFGLPDQIESTSDLLENLRDDEKYSVDEDAFIRARLFDMLLGDWDRHTDQWRWARFDKSDDKIVYKPIPRDRDQVFSNYDGRFLDIIKFFIPPAQQFQTYSGELKDVNWINSAGIKLDRALLANSTLDDWLKQAKHIETNLTDTAIDQAFKAIPIEVQNAQWEAVKSQLKQRRNTLTDIARRYYKHLNSLVILTGTDKDDYFTITREKEGTRVQISRIKDDAIQPPFVDRLIDPKVTKELWIYGLDDDDQFRVSGKESKPIFTRIIGGQNNDVYRIENGRKVKIYEHKTKPNTYEKIKGATLKRSNIYVHNTYDFNKGIVYNNTLLPSIGGNPDDGFFIGLQNTFTVKGFKNDPFYRKHIVKAGYYFATNGFDINYNGIFSNALGQWDLTLGGRATNESYARNFFGLSNESVNNQDDLGLDYNRVRTANYVASVGVAHRNPYGSHFFTKAMYEFVEVQQNANRFISNDFDPPTPDYFEGQQFAGLETGYSYNNADNPANPTRGMDFSLALGTKMNLDNTDRIYGYILPRLGFYNALSRNKKWVLKTLFQGQVNLGDDFEFYQGAVVGGNSGLRGYRNQRFTGESSFAASSDIRYSFNRFKTGLLPIQIGLYAGGDVGRVWNDGESSNVWHTDVGGGFWINAVDLMSGQFGIFVGDDGPRVAFGLGVKL
ncbi:MAG: phosphoesterase [Cytophagaceae bacterium]|nr:phosphoesterase [Cytophagaceae bacterium]